MHGFFLSLALLAHPTVTDTAIIGSHGGDPTPRFEKHYPAERVLVVPAETTVELPENSTYDAIAIFGRLTASRTRDTVCRVIHLQVYPGGVLDLGTPDDPIPPERRVEIIYRDVPLRTGQPGSPDIDPTQIGNGLLVFGSYNAHGRKVQPRTWATGALAAGATKIDLPAIPEGWRVGDELLIPDTRQPWYVASVVGPSEPIREESRVTIAAIEGTTLTLSKPLDFAHDYVRNPDGTPVATPLVANLSRNVVMRSENQSGTRAHAIFLEMSHVDSRYAAYVGMGRTNATPIDNTTFADGDLTHVGTNQIARYPFHWHHSHGHADEHGIHGRAIGNVIDGLYGTKWGLVQHGTHDVQIDDNIVLRCIGAGLVTEDGYEVRGQYNRNLAAYIPGNGKSALENEAANIPGGEGVGFWLHGMMQAFRGNIAANSFFGWQFFYRSQVEGRKYPSTPGGENDTPADPKTMIPLLLEDNYALANRVGVETWNNPPFWSDRFKLLNNHQGWVAGEGQPGSVRARDIQIVQQRGDGIHTSSAYTGSAIIERGEILGCDVGLHNAMISYLVKGTRLQNRLNIDNNAGRASGILTIDHWQPEPMPGLAPRYLHVETGLDWKAGDPPPTWYLHAGWGSTPRVKIITDAGEWYVTERQSLGSRDAMWAVGYQAPRCPEKGLTNAQCAAKYGWNHFGLTVPDNQVVSLPGVDGIALKVSDHVAGPPRSVIPQPNMLAAWSPENGDHVSVHLTGDLSQSDATAILKLDDQPEFVQGRDSFDLPGAVRFGVNKTPGTHSVTIWRRDKVTCQKIAASERRFSYFVGQPSEPGPEPDPDPDPMPEPDPDPMPDPDPPADPTIAQLTARIEQLEREVLALLERIVDLENFRRDVKAAGN